MPSYITAKGLQLALSKTSDGWPANTAGKDTQTGTAKNDIFHGAGGDTLIGGQGDDTYTLWDNLETVVEKPGEGIDTIDARFWGAVTLADNVENLLLNSAGSTAGTGNALSNIIIAGTVGATIDGMGGDDVLVGGAGADVFKVGAGNGSDAIMNFKSGSDTILLRGYNITTFDQLKALGTQSGADVKFAFANGESLVLRDIKLTDLTAYDFGMRPTITPASGLNALTGPSAVYSDKGWYVLNNIWNPGTLVYGKDYFIDSSYSATDLTAKTTFNWSFPTITDPSPTIRAYPEVIFGPAPMSGGNKITDVAGVFPVQVSAIANLTADYDVTFAGNKAGFNVSFDIWLTNTPNGGRSTITNEVMIWVHKGGFEAFGKQVGTYTDAAGNTAKIYTNTADWTYTAIVFDKDVPKGQLDLDGIFAALQKLGIVKSTEYLASVELGAEVVSGAGSLTINNLDLTLQTASSGGSVKTMSVTGSGTTTKTTTTVTVPIDNNTNVVTTPTTPVTSTPTTPTAPVTTPTTPVTTPTTPVTTPTTPETSTGASGADRIAYSSTAVKIDGGAGSDTLLLKAGATIDLSKTANQALTGSAVVVNFEHIDASASSGAVILTAAAAGSTLIGSTFGDTITGGAGNDYIDGNGGADKISAGQGDDRVVYYAGASLIDGGAGTDTLIVNNALTVNLGNFSGSMVTGGSAYVTGFENADATNSVAAVTLNGSQYNNTLIGSAFNDTLLAGDGYDIVKGGAGNDYIDGGAGVDQLFGEFGDDRIVYDAADTIVDGGAGIDTLVLKTAATVNLANYSQVTGSAGTVTGFENVDASGATAGVTITGSAGANVLIGSAFADKLAGGAGSDTLTGGAGADVFKFDAYAAGDVDTITDFSRAQGDKIDLTAIDAIKGGTDNAFAFIGETAFHNVAGELRAFAVSGGTMVQGDVDGNGTADFSILVQNVSSLVATDFFL
jgi:serralysin